MPLIEDANLTISEDIPSLPRPMLKLFMKSWIFVTERSFVSWTPCDTAIPFSLVNDVGLNVLFMTMTFMLHQRRLYCQQWLGQSPEPAALDQKALDQLEEDSLSILSCFTGKETQQSHVKGFNSSITCSRSSSWSEV